MRVLILLLVLCAGSAYAQTKPLTHLQEQRYCGVPERDARGRIARSRIVLTAFKHQHPCPVNGRITGVCPGWAIDHVVPLACGGCDAVSNLQWLPNTIKNCAGPNCKDRWERRVYCR